MADDVKPAPAAALGRFGHHRDPAMDFANEVFEIEAQVAEPPGGTIDRKALEERIARAMSFRVGGTVMGMAAKQALRDAEEKFKQHQATLDGATNWQVIRINFGGRITIMSSNEGGPLLFPDKKTASDYYAKHKLPGETVEIVPAELRIGESKP